MKAAVLAALLDHPLLQPRGEMDTAAYVELAAHPAALPFFVSPLYLYFLRLAGVSLFAAKVVQIILGSVAVVLIFDMTRRWTGLSFRAAGAAEVTKKRRRLSGTEPTQRGDRPRPTSAGMDAHLADVAAILAILTGIFSFHEVTILQAALDPFLVALTLWCLTVALQSGKTVAFAGTGAALGLLVLNRPNALLWLPVLLLGTVLLGRDSEERAGRWRDALVVLIAFSIPIAPVTIRNYAVSHRLVLIASHGGLNFFIGNHAQADGTYHHVEGIRPTIAGQEADATRVAAAAMHRPEVTADEASSYFYRQAWEWIRSHPAAAFALFLRKIAYTFNQTDLALNYSYSYFTRDVRSLLKFLVIGPWLLFPLGLAGAWRLLRESGSPGALGGGSPSAPATAEDERVVSSAPHARMRRAALRLTPFAVWATFVPVYALSVALFFVSSRYRMPLLVPMCVTAPAMFMRPFRARHWVVAAILAAGVCWNFGLDDGRAHERTNMIVYLAEQHRFDEAARLLDSTALITRDPGTLYLRSAQAFQAAGGADRAVQLIGRVDPALVAPAQARELADVARRSAVELVQTNQPEKALPAFAAAHRLDPSDASDLLNAAVLEAQRGDFAGARRDANAALQLRPGYAQAEGLLRAIEGR